MGQLFVCAELKPMIKVMAKGSLFYLYCATRDFHPNAKDCSRCDGKEKLE